MTRRDILKLAAAPAAAPALALVPAKPKLRYFATTWPTTGTMEFSDGSPAITLTARDIYEMSFLPDGTLRNVRRIATAYEEDQWHRIVPNTRCPKLADTFIDFVNAVNGALRDAIPDNTKSFLYSDNVYWGKLFV